MTAYKTVNAYTVQLVTTGGKRVLVMRPAPNTADYLVTMDLGEAKFALENGACTAIVCGDDRALAAMMGATVEVQL